MPRGEFAKRVTERPCKRCGKTFLGRSRAYLCDTCKYTCPDCGGPKKWRSGTWCYECSLKHRDTSKYKENIKRARQAANTPEAREALRQSLMGHPVSEETKRKIGKANVLVGHLQESGRKGGHAGKGKTKSQEWKRKARERFLGPKNPQWKDGSAAAKYGPGWIETLREAIRQRDNHQCQICGISQDSLSRKLDVHHIDGDKHNHAPENLVALCSSCHHKVTSRKDFSNDYFSGR